MTCVEVQNGRRCLPKAIPCSEDEDCPNGFSCYSLKSVDTCMPSPVVGDIDEYNNNNNNNHDDSSETSTIT
eukprot:UN03559